MELMESPRGALGARRIPEVVCVVNAKVLMHLALGTGSPPPGQCDHLVAILPELGRSVRRSSGSEIEGGRSVDSSVEVKLKYADR